VGRGNLSSEEIPCAYWDFTGIAYRELTTDGQDVDVGRVGNSATSQ
jgi:hypothetical protein